MVTDDDILVNRHEACDALMCIQKKADKKIVTDEDLTNSNVNSFGDDIGRITNHVTSMYEVRSRFEVGSNEWNELTYRIKTGQNYQQNSIDKAKGIISKPMPLEWYNRHSALAIQDEDKKRLYLSILADKKPRFMIYIYPELNKKYQEYCRNTNKKCERAFNMPLNELLAKSESELSAEQLDFVTYYRKLIPVGTSRCTMNIICEKFEERFDGWIGKRRKEQSFDYSIMRSEDAEYTPKQFSQIKQLYKEYSSRVRAYSIYAHFERVDPDDVANNMSSLDMEFRNACDQICSNAKVLCNILLDLCYVKGNNKRFVWAMCGKEIIENLLEKNDYTISFPVQDENGDVEFAGKKFRMTSKKLEAETWQ